MTSLPTHNAPLRSARKRCLPWWRVLRADGTAAEHLRDRQLALLRAEGTPMAAFGDGVDLRRARWEAAGGDHGTQGSLFD